MNPVTGRADGAYAPHAASAGAVFFPPRAPLPWTPNRIEKALLARAQPPDAADEARVEAGAADAQCVDGRLEVREIRSARVRRAPVWGDNYHAWDYALFWMDVRRDVARRVAAFDRARRSRVRGAERVRDQVRPAHGRDARPHEAAGLGAAAQQHLAVDLGRL